jgi:uncharacterized membrane protein YozB (DUF420 family)
MDIKDLPTLNTVFNLISTMLLIRGRAYIKNDDRDKHKKYMVGALISSALFLISYLIYHANVGSVPYPHYNWTRPIYFSILIPHIILAAIMGPFILLAVYFALKEKFDQHRMIVRWVWPVWVFVSISGILIYLMLYVL